MTVSPTPPSGWYPDPGGAPRQRYFDGSAWTEHYAPVAVPVTALIEIPQVRSLKVPTCGRGQCIGWRVPVVARRRVSVAA
jgi:hypothetical protein